MRAGTPPDSHIGVLAFDHVAHAQRVVFGTGGARTALTLEVERNGARRVMVISSKRDVPVVESLTADIDVAIHLDHVVPHVPAGLASEATRTAAESGIDLVVAVGGGSATGLAKIVARDTDVRVIAVPTTYSGSEATTVWGITEDGRKVTGVDERVLPVTIVYDADLTLTLPVGLSVASGLNAIAHCIDAMWAPRADPISSMTAAEGIRILAAGLPLVAADPDDVAGREQALLGSYLSASAFSSAGSGLHHKICHVLGGAYDLPHAQTHAIVLPHVLAFNSPAAPEAAERIAAAFGTTDAVAGLQTLRRRLGAPNALRDVGFRAEDIPEAAELILAAVPPSNPRSVTVENIAELLCAALTGVDPTARKDK
ncbi:maleylacetate reductase [Gordonia bronchialis]|uniref:maleylacetate reductase n=1 Tax=Gordonia bronchialis TaxID=2054 RepID=UPI00226E0DF5|nr:maleylacetate reductase [Gordonia bronchialis]